MKGTLIWYPKCSTCQKAKKVLEELGVELELRHIVEEALSEQELRDFSERAKTETKKLFNTSGLKYKALNLKEKLPMMSEDEKFALLASDGMLVKRPIFVSEDGVVIVGKKEEQYQALMP